MRNFTHLAGAALMLGVLLLLACEESPVTPVGDLVPSFAKPPGGGGGGPNSGTPLSVTLSTAGDVTGDGIGPYVDGDDGVLAIIDQNDDLKFDIDAPKKGTPRKICFNFRPENLVDEPTDPAVLENQPICGGPLWNTRGVSVELNGMGLGQSGEFGSRFIVTSDTGVEYKVRYGAATISACNNFSLDDRGSSSVFITRVADGLWTLDATDRVAFVEARDTNIKGKNSPGFQCVGTYTMSWVATLATN